MRVAFFLPNASDARYRKRINALEKNGVEATVLAFKRNYYLGKPFDNDYTLLGNISHSTSAKRFTALFQITCWDGYSISTGIGQNGFIKE